MKKKNNTNQTKQNKQQQKQNDNKIQTNHKH